MTHDSPRPRRRFQLLPDDRMLGWTPYLWLAYFPAFFVVPALKRAGPAEWAVTIAGGLLFLVLYFRGYWARGRELIAIIVVIALMGFAFTPSNVWASVFITYAAAFAGVLRPQRHAIIGLLLLAVSVVLMGLAGVIGFPFWPFQVMLVLMIGASNIHFMRVRGMTRALDQARIENENLARVAERERIARDLHDVLGHTLTLITLKSALAARIAESDPARAAGEMREVERVSRETLQDVRDAVAGAREAGLAHEVKSAGMMLEAAGVQVEQDVAPMALSAAEEATLALAIREAVTNVVRHAGATLCRISLSSSGGARRLSIVDDGRGKRAPDGNGLAGMRQRVRALGGELVVDGAERGTRVLITLAEGAR